MAGLDVTGRLSRSSSDLPDVSMFISSVLLINELQWSLECFSSKKSLKENISFFIEMGHKTVKCKLNSVESDHSKSLFHRDVKSKK